MTDVYPNEVEQAASRAWLAMVTEVPFFARTIERRTPMPAAVALDMVQDVTGDRDDAVCALLMAAAIWLDDARPEQPVGRISTSLNTAISVRGHLLGEGYGLAENCLRELMDLNREIRNDYHHLGLNYGPADDARAAAWHQWGHKAKRAIEVCRQVTAAR